MAASFKRQCSDENYMVPKKKAYLQHDEKLEEFLKWCQQNNFNISSKVTVNRKDSCAQYGMIALDDIAEGYCLFQVPRSCLLMPENTDISNLITQDIEKLTSSNQWIPLLISLIHEQSKEWSMWKPYLDLVPDYAALDLPVFWNREDLNKYLANSRVDHNVQRDSYLMKEDFEKNVCPFFQRHAKQIGENMKDLEFFKRQVAFVMAYSFTEPKENEDGDSHNGKEVNDSDSEDEDAQVAPPMMVPMADMLNHVTNHNAKLTFGKEALKMVTTRAIKKGEEIYNTYGQVSNLHLMHMYGFTEPFPDNTHDVVEIPVPVMLNAALDSDKYKSGFGDQDFINNKWDYLMDQNILVEDETFVVDRGGIVNDEICLETIKVLCKNKAEFEDYKANGGWSDDESNSSVSGHSKLSLDNIAGLDKEWKRLLRKMSELHLSNYPTTLDENTETMKQASTLGSREKYSLYLVHGQKMILKSLIDACR